MRTAKDDRGAPLFGFARKRVSVNRIERVDADTDQIASPDIVKRKIIDRLIHDPETVQIVALGDGREDGQRARRDKRKPDTLGRGRRIREEHIKPMCH